MTWRRRTRPSAGHRAGSATAIAFLLAAAGAAAASEDVVAVRTEGRVRLDGRLDDAAWREAPPYSRFVESFPRAGVPASLRTEVRVLYDDETLWIGVDCSDPEPAAIVRQLARRDSDVTSDRVEVALDPGATGHTAYHLVVNAAGVLRDRLLFADVNGTDTWDAVWDAAVSVDAHGWSAEIAVPFRQLRLPDAGRRTWGIVVRRVVPRTHQVLDSTPIPRDANPVAPGALVVSRLGRLEGLGDLEPRRGLELLPYVASRAALRPRYSDPARPRPRLLDPGVDVGLDLKMAIARQLTLTATVNPDFAQVETDEVIQNLSNAEPFFPEKRPFFLEGLEIFQPVGSEYFSNQQLFYSRRIGLDAPILAAAKVTGSARPGLRIGVLDAVVMGAGNASLVPVGYQDPDPATLAPYEADPDRRWRFRLRQPFHFGPEDALPAAHPVTTNYFAGVARQAVGSRSTAGLTFAAATPLEPRCLRSEFQSDADWRDARCEGHGGNVLGLDLAVPGAWGGFAQAEVTQAVGGPADGRRLPDGTVLRAGDLGLAGHMRAGKLGGEPWRFDVSYFYQDARADLDQVGFAPFSNFQWVDLVVHYVRPGGLGRLHAFQVDYLLDVNWSADGKWTPRGINSNVYSELQLPGFQTVGARVGVEIPQYDAREIAFSGAPFERQGNVFGGLLLGSDPSRRLQVKGDVFVLRTLRRGAFGPETGWGWDLSLSWRPHDRLETRVEAHYGRKPQGPRWVETLPDDTAVFGLQEPEFLSVTVRQQVVFTPRLSAQIYAQLFGSAVRF
ncbi:MAG TPA: DUF5916 domain-containing protein, partial [Anaeromyxobacteraceae bacterium]|nr:DUF5916 domain-containing protein [Anaeromyxobacteraceae bacterium]